MRFGRCGLGSLGLRRRGALRRGCRVEVRRAPPSRACRPARQGPAKAGSAPHPRPFPAAAPCARGALAWRVPAPASVEVICGLLRPQRAPLPPAWDCSRRSNTAHSEIFLNRAQWLNCKAINTRNLGVFLSLRLYARRCQSNCSHTNVLSSSGRTCSFFGALVRSVPRFTRMLAGREVPDLRPYAGSQPFDTEQVSLYGPRGRLEHLPRGNPVMRRGRQEKFSFSP